MKFLALVVLCSVVAAVKAGMSKEEKIAAFRPIADACASETGASATDIEAVIKHKPAANMETKCLRACIMKKLDLMNADGKFDKEAALKICDYHTSGDAEKMKIAEEVIGACAGIAVPDDHCEAAEHYKMCLNDEAKKHGVNMDD